MKVIPRLQINEATVENISVRGFIEDCKSAFMNYNYRMLLIGYLLLSATLGVRDTISLHMNTYFWELLPEQIRTIVLFIAVAPFVAFFITAPLHNRFEKKPVIISCLGLLLCFATTPVLLRIVGLFPENDSPYLFPTLVGFVAINATLAIVLLISVMSVLADIADEHELTTHRRQEGMFYAARSFFAKASSALGHLLAGIAIDVIAFPVGAKPGTVDPDTVLHLGLIDGPIAVIPGAIAILFYLRYNLSRARHADIQAELASRRATRVTQ